MQGKALPRLVLIPGGFPLPKGGGRIETRIFVCHVKRGQCFPLPKGGGRIETHPMRS